MWKIYAKNSTRLPFLEIVISGYKVEHAQEIFPDIEIVFGTPPPRQTIEEEVECGVLKRDIFGYPLVAIAYTAADGPHWYRDRCGKLEKTESKRLIIEQDIARVTHAQSASDYVRLGRDVEVQVLSCAIYAHFRVLLNGGKTVVFPASPSSFASERKG